MMNPFLPKLGLSAADRALIVHADDVSMCQAALASFTELIEIGLVTSGSVMVPAPWFRATAAFARATPSADLGLHTTLTSEWEGYRWSALTTRDPASGLLDEQGCFPRGPAPLWEKARIEAAVEEIEAQLRTAREAGIDVTHVDDHMGVWSHPRFAPHYTQFCLRHRMPPRAILRQVQDAERRLSLSKSGAVEIAQGEGENAWERAYVEAVQQFLAGGLPLFDHIGGLPLDDHDSHEERILRFAADLPPGGLGLIIAHPALDTPELRAIAPDWRGRVANHRAFASRAVKQALLGQGIKLVGFRELKEVSGEK